jgi:Flp pilus assembly protein TadG
MRFAANDGAVRRGRASNFIPDQRGATAVIFAGTLPVVLLAMAVAIDYTNASRFKTRVQAAADAASLAATEALARNPNGANGLSVEQYAQQVANGYFTANAPPGATGAPTVTASSYNSTVTVAVGYQGTAPSNFGSVLGYSGFTASTSSTAQAVVGEKTGAGNKVGATHYSGYGVIGGDPHVYGFDNHDYYLACSAAGQTPWINILSDAGIEINASCVRSIYFGMDALQTVSILLGSHVISTYAPSPQVPYQYGPITYNAATAWFGQVTVDGVNYPAVKGTRTLLSQPVPLPNGLSVTQWVSDTTNFYFVDNAIYVNYGPYQITLSYQNNAMADLWITATNAGACGVPGGALGATLAGIDDTTTSDFSVSGPTATTYQFGWSTCPAWVNNSKASVARLIK